MILVQSMVEILVNGKSVRFIVNTIEYESREAADSIFERVHTALVTEVPGRRILL